uniref:Uncharacterized protein n=1 Tax=Alexandrium catenella TaxID=2925 RepID=A0A7S1RM60_ALECA
MDAALERRYNRSTMKSQLQALQREDSATIFIARHINKLGFNSADRLCKYFSSYGQVKKVWVSHSRVKSVRIDNSWRMRAASLGFVVMVSADATMQVLTDGPEHNVGGVKISVQPFHQCGSSDASSPDGDSTALPDGDTSASPDGDTSVSGSADANIPTEGERVYQVEFSDMMTRQQSLESEMREVVQDRDLLPCFFARFSEQELYDAQPEQYED